MPTVNIYYHDPGRIQKLSGLLAELREFVAVVLTCGDMILEPDEVSLRLIKVNGLMIGDIELEVHAHAFSERVVRQDQICLELREFLRKRIGEAEDVRVWLVLSELGHSWG